MPNNKNNKKCNKIMKTFQLKKKNPKKKLLKIIKLTVKHNNNN